MSLKETVEKHAAIFFLATLVTGFTAGWSAHGAVQTASGLSAVSVERLRSLDTSEMTEKKLVARIAQLEADKVNLYRQLLDNRPKGRNYVTNISLSPPSPSALTLKKQITVTFDYVLASKLTARIYAYGLSEGNQAATYQSSELLTERGRISRYVYLARPGKIDTINIAILSEEDESVLYEVNLPVEYTYE